MIIWVLSEQPMNPAGLQMHPLVAWPHVQERHRQIHRLGPFRHCPLQKHTPGIYIWMGRTRAYRWGLPLQAWRAMPVGDNECSARSELQEVGWLLPLDLFCDHVDAGCSCSVAAQYISICGSAIQHRCRSKTEPPRCNIQLPKHRCFFPALSIYQIVLNT